MSVITERKTSAQYKIGLAANYTDAYQKWVDDQSYACIFMTGDIGYFLNGNFLMPSPVGSGYQDSVSYNASLDELTIFDKASHWSQQDKQTILEDFMAKFNSINENSITSAGLVAAWQELKGYDFDHGTDVKTPLPLGDITEFFALMRDYCVRTKLDNGVSINYDSFKAYAQARENESKSHFVLDEDMVEEFTSSEDGRLLMNYLYALRSNTGIDLVFLKRMISQAYLPMHAPVGTIVEGLWSQFDLPTPPNLVKLSARTFNYDNANPLLSGKSLGNYYACATRTAETGEEVGDYLGSRNSIRLENYHLPTSSYSVSGSLTPRGSVSVSSYSGSKTTSSDSHRHKMYGDSASDVRSSSGGSGSDLVLNNNDGRQRADYWWTESDSHTHSVSISHGHSASFSGSSTPFSTSFKINNGSQSSIDLRGNSLIVDRYFVAW